MGILDLCDACGYAKDDPNRMCECGKEQSKSFDWVKTSRDIASAINANSLDNFLDTPGFELAEKALDSLLGTQATTKWNGPEDGLPPLGMELDGVKCVSSTEGIVEWWNKPYWKVVGHHINGKTFFVEGVKSGVIQQFTTPSEKPQYRPIKTERERVIEKMVEVMNSLSNPKNDQGYVEAIYDQVIEPMREGE